MFNTTQEISFSEKKKENHKFAGGEGLGQLLDNIELRMRRLKCKELKENRTVCELEGFQ